MPPGASSPAACSVDVPVEDAKRLAAEGRLLRAARVLDGAEADCPAGADVVDRHLVEVLTTLGDLERLGAVLARIAARPPALDGDLLEAAMTDLSAWLADGSARPLPVTTYPLADAARAHQAIESGQTVGKLVLVPPGVS